MGGDIDIENCVKRLQSCAPKQMELLLLIDRFARPVLGESKPANHGPPPYINWVSLGVHVALVPHQLGCICTAAAPGYHLIVRSLELWATKTLAYHGPSRPAFRCLHRSHGRGYSLATWMSDKAILLTRLSLHTNWHLCVDLGGPLPDRRHAPDDPYTGLYKWIP